MAGVISSYSLVVWNSFVIRSSAVQIRATALGFWGPQICQAAMHTCVISVHLRRSLKPLEKKKKDLPPATKWPVAATKWPHTDHKRLIDISNQNGGETYMMILSRLRVSQRTQLCTFLCARVATKLTSSWASNFVLSSALGLPQS